MRKILRWLGATATALFFISIYTPLWNEAAAKLAVPPSIRKTDAIVVLGAGGLANGKLGDESLRRAVLGIQLFKQGMAPTLILSGPQSDSGKSEAEIRKGLAIQMGIPAEAIHLIEDVRTTRDEASQVASLMSERHGKTVLLVTESLHMRRAQRVFESTGLTTLAAPDDNTGHKKIRWTADRADQLGAAAKRRPPLLPVCRVDLARMEEFVVPLVVLITSAAAAVFLGRALTIRSLKVAVGQLFEFLGILVLFWALNTGAVFSLGLVLRALPFPFVSLYIVSDPMLLIFSVIQSLLFSFLRSTDLSEITRARSGELPGKERSVDRSERSGT